MWSPSGPEVTPAVRQGWTGGGPDVGRPAPVAGWWAVDQLVGWAESHAEYAGLVRAYLAAVSAGRATISAALVAHLVGVSVGHGAGGAAGEVSDAGVKAYLTGWAASSGIAGARAAYAPGATYLASAAHMAAIRARLDALGAGLGATQATLAAHLAGMSPGLSAPTASADFAATPPTTTSYGAGTFTYAIPAWSKLIVLVGIGGGASGQTGNGGINQHGTGGNAGSWNGVVLRRGVDIPWSLAQITVTVGAGGAQPANSNWAGPNAGGTTTFTASGVSLSCAGGVGTNGGTNGGGIREGAAAGNYQIDGDTYVGGAIGGGSGAAGNAPGGGGSGGNGGVFSARTLGGKGGDGRAWIKARQ